MPTITVPEKFADELATTFDEDLEQLRLDVGLLLSQGMPESEVVDKAVRGGFGRPFAEWYVRQQATFGRDVRLIVAPPIPARATAEEKSRLRAGGGLFVFVGLAMVTLSRVLLLPSEELGFLTLIVVILGGALEVIGARKLAESKGYAASTGWWVLAFFWPFIIWYWLAEDRWDVSNRSFEPHTTRTPGPNPETSPPSTPAESKDKALQDARKNALRYVDMYRDEGFNHARRMFVQDFPDLDPGTVYNAFASLKVPTEAPALPRNDANVSDHQKHSHASFFTGWKQLEPVTFVARVMSAYLVFAALILIVHANTGNMRFWPERWHFRSNRTMERGTQNAMTDLVIGGLLALGASVYAMTYRKR